MENLPKDKLLQYNPDTLEEVRKLFGLNDPEAMKDAVDILDEWVKKQHHFTNRNIDRRYLEATIIISKGSLETAKSRLDKSCTIRTLMPHMFKIYDIRQIFQAELKCVTQAALPKMTKNNERVVIHKVAAKELDPAVTLYFNYTLPAFAEYVRRNDYAVSNHFVVDYLDAEVLELTKRLTITDLQETVTYGLGCCGFRLKGFYVISSSKLIEGIVTLFRKVLGAKLGSRIHVLKDRESLNKIFDKEVLPKDYGGFEKPLAELQEEWLNIITSKEHLEYLKEINSCCTDESKRQNCLFNQEYMGVPGSFRKMNVD
ncbi:CRAL/TRIO domain-containing protein [Phthorimaea operculella]|nr:CRAL/TRIO domain-containing protein [Phthorimaea operculella]